MDVTAGFGDGVTSFGTVLAAPVNALHPPTKSGLDWMNQIFLLAALRGGQVRRVSRCMTTDVSAAADYTLAIPISVCEKSLPLKRSDSPEAFERP